MNRDGRKLIKGEALIRVSRVEKSSEINKRACPIIRHLRVPGFEPGPARDKDFPYVKCCWSGVIILEKSSCNWYKL